MRQVHEPIILPRGLIFLASLWLMGSWLISIGVHAPIQPSSAAYTPGVRTMLLCVTLGLMIGWPLLRLSQSPHVPGYEGRVRSHPIQQTLLDIVVLLGLMQVVVWPLRLVTNWSPARTAAIDATITGWMLLAGAVTASALMTERRGPRSLAMLACVVMCLLGPFIAWLGAMGGLDATSLVDLSPLTAVRTLGESGNPSLTDSQWQWIMVLGVAAGAAWIALSMTGWLRDRESKAEARAARD